jgi:opacity protein-like surface antigen
VALTPPTSFRSRLLSVRRNINERRVFAALVVSTFGAPAVAADLAVPHKKVQPPAMNWSGCCLGADVGVGWSSREVSNMPAPIIDQAGMVGTINGAGGIGSGYSRCNVQLTPVWVARAEANFSGMHLGGTVDAADVLRSTCDDRGHRLGRSLRLDCHVARAPSRFSKHRRRGLPQARHGKRYRRPNATRRVELQF